MRSNPVKRFTLWTAWNYDREEKWLDQMSAQGFHFEKSFLFWSTFRKEPSVRYTYRLDYQSLRGERFQEYINLFTDAGWEHTYTYAGCWHYFRRSWQPGELQELYKGADAPEATLLWVLAAQMAAVLLLGYGFVRISQKVREIPRGE